MPFGSVAPQVIVTAELRGSELQQGGREAGVSNSEKKEQVRTCYTGFSGKEHRV